MFMNRDLKDQILSVLKKDQSGIGLPIKNVAEKINASVQTTSKFCHILEAEKKITITKFGNMKILKLR